MHHIFAHCALHALRAHSPGLGKSVNHKICFSEENCSSKPMIRKRKFLTEGKSQVSKMMNLPFGFTATEVTLFHFVNNFKPKEKFQRSTKEP